MEEININLAEEYIHPCINKKMVLYKIYISRDYKIHANRYPVIYMNKSCLYFKDHNRNDECDGNLGLILGEEKIKYLQSKASYKELLEGCVSLISEHFSLVEENSWTIRMYDNFKGYTLYPIDNEEIKYTNENMSIIINSYRLNKLKQSLIESKNSQLEIQSEIDKLEKEIEEYKSNVKEKLFSNQFSEEISIDTISKSEE